MLGSRNRDWYRAIRRVARYSIALIAVVIVVGVAYMAYDYARDEPEEFFDDPVKQFKYGSTGGDRLAGVPAGIFKALPELCRDYLPGEGWQSLGFVFEEGMDRPVGTSKRHHLGFDRIGLNCSVCHVGTYRTAPESRPVVVPGMPANRLDLARFAQFLTSCALDERFNPWQVPQAAERSGANLSLLNRLLLEFVGVPAMREALILARYRFRFFDREPAPGPGRFDTFGPAKALLNWPLEKIPSEQSIGIVDFPSLWLQGPRAKADMRLHWDGNNDSVEERNRSAGFGTGAVPSLADRKSLSFIAGWLRSDANQPPKYPLAIDPARADRGKILYGEYCAACHGVDGRDFSGARVGTVEPITYIRTDPCRLDNYTHDLAAEQGNLYAAYPEERFSHFRKTNGYANAPLDGIWLRAPYLHNGSVPTIRDLLEPAEKRPKAFYRGYDVIDQRRLGFASDVSQEGNVGFFRYETQCVADPGECAREQNPENRHDDNACHPGKWVGNSNRGHEGPAYGTNLSAADKDAIVEYLKTF
jgi:processive rubber oxygenase RoxA-like protein